METTTCCVAGGGPAGVMLGLLLARAGVNVTVLEKHGDFLRDFRGDTIHTSTIELMADLGIADEFMKLPHEKARNLSANVGGVEVPVTDFAVLGGNYPFILFMPQWDFLDFITGKARAYPNFTIHMNAEVTDVLRDGDRVTGVKYRKDGADHELRADLTVASDGRGSTIRQVMGDQPVVFGAPMDVLWFHLPREATDGGETGGRITRGRMLVMIDRGDYWQMAFIVAKGTAEKVRADGLEAFRDSVAAIVPEFGAERMQAIKSLDDVKTLVVEVNRLEKWHRPGLLYIGDAAHAMSPIGGVGVNLAIQDAVAAANILAEPLKAGTITESDLARVQKRRMFPIAFTQKFQRTAQKRVIGAALSGTHTPRPPSWLPSLLRFWPIKRLIAQMIGRGLRPEHISPKILSSGR